MGSVYSHALRVVIWVGRSQVKATEDLEFNGPVATDILRAGDEGLVDEDLCTLVPRWTWGHDWDGQFENNGADVSPGIPCSLMSQNITARAYWTRLWILQEVALASDIIVRCGGMSLDWYATVQPICQLLEDNHQQTAIHDSDHIPRVAVSTVYILNNHRKPRRRRPKDGSASPKSLLLDLVIQFRMSKCQNVRDRVFGVLNFSELCCREANPVDYLLHPTTIAARLLDHHLRYHEQDTRGTMRLCLSLSKPLDLGFSHGAEEVETNWLSPDHTSTLRGNGLAKVSLRGKYCGKIIWIASMPSADNMVSRSLDIPELYLPDFGKETIEASQLFTTTKQNIYFNRNSEHPCNRSSPILVQATLNTSSSIIGQFPSFLKDKMSPSITLQATLDSADTSNHHSSKSKPNTTRFSDMAANLQTTQGLRYFVTSSGFKGFVTEQASIGSRILELDNGERRLAVLSVSSDECKLVGKGLALPTKETPRFSLGMATKRPELEIVVDMESLFYLAGFF